MDSKKYFIEGFINTALQDGIQTLMESDPNADISYTFDQQAKHSLEKYASHMFELLDKEFNLSEKYRKELIELGGDLYIAAMYDYSYTFLDNEEGTEILHGNRLDVYYYIYSISRKKILLTGNLSAD